MIDQQQSREEPNKNSQLLTIGDVAEQLAVSTSTIYRLLATGELPRRRIRGPPGLPKAMWRN
jgi:excisionase family DNA binding protein